MKLYQRCMELLFPPKCILCGKLLKKEDSDLCGNCRRDGPEYPNRKESIQFLDSFTAVWYYEGNVRRSLVRYKFYNARSYAQGYGRILAGKLQEEFDCITWVPVSPLRKLTRGYDQVELLAQAVGQQLQMQPVPLLKKIRHNRPQSTITGAAKRRANVLGAYREENREEISGKRILLLDDILTTGATAGECARVLLTAGAKEIHCAVVAAARK